MNILYIHGLDSKLIPEKRAVLKKYGKVFSPDLNYYTDPDAIATVLEMCRDMEIDAVVGSSMGGFAGYYVANALNRPALLFNPALMERSVPQNIPSEIDNYNSLKQIVLGQIDEVVSPVDTLSFLTKNFNPVTDLHLHVVPRLGHNIPVEFFEEEVGAFFGKLEFRS